MALIPYWLEHGDLMPGAMEHVSTMCVLAKVKVARFQEKKVSVKSKLSLGMPCQ